MKGRVSDGSEPQKTRPSMIRVRWDETRTREVKKEADRLGLTVSEFARLALMHYVNEIRAIREKSQKRAKSDSK